MLREGAPSQPLIKPSIGAVHHHRTARGRR
jgi:hypothetical protein